MEFKVNKNSEFPIYQQLKEQIKFYLLSGALQPGTRVPTPKDLGAYLQINRNTVIAAYKELEQEGLLMTKQGQGTYIADELPAFPRNEGNQALITLAQETIEKTRELGFTPEDLFTIIYNKTILGLDTSAKNIATNSIRALMVECNLPDLEHYQNTLRQELGIQVDACLVDELPDKINEVYVRNADFVVTNFTHLEDIKAILEPLHKVVFAVMAAPYLQTFMEISKLPAGARAGLVCITKAYTIKMKKAIEDAGINHITLDNCGIDDLDAFNRMLQQADYIISSRAVIDTVRKMVPTKIKILEYAPELDRAGIEMLRQYLAANFDCNKKPS